MTATRLDINLEQGADYLGLFQVVDAAGKPVNITGNALAMQIRSAIGDRIAFVSLTTADQTIAIATGQLGFFSLPGLTAAAIWLLDAGYYVYDIDMLDTSGVRSRIFEGTAKVLGGVTMIILEISAGDILLENGGNVLQEDGSKILTETFSTSNVILENGGNMLREDGSKILTEG